MTPGVLKIIMLGYSDTTKILWNTNFQQNQFCFSVIIQKIIIVNTWNITFT